MLVYLALSLLTLYLFVRDVGFSGVVGSEDTQQPSQPTPYPLGSGIKVLPSKMTTTDDAGVTAPAPTKARVLDSPTMSFSFCSG